MSHVQYLDDLVKEYLLFRGFTHTLRTLDNEIKIDKDKGFRVSCDYKNGIIGETRKTNLCEVTVKDVKEKLVSVNTHTHHFRHTHSPSQTHTLTTSNTHSPPQTHTHHGRDCWVAQ